MHRHEITFDEAERILRESGAEFRDLPEINAIGIAERDRQLRFVVSVRPGGTFERLKAEYAGKEIGGCPVWIEQGEMVALSGEVGVARPRIWNSNGTPVRRQSTIRWIVGAIVAGLAGILALAALTSSG